MSITKSFLLATLFLLQIVPNAEAFTGGAYKSPLFNAKVTNHEEDLDLTRRIILHHINNESNLSFSSKESAEEITTDEKEAVGTRLSKLKNAKHQLIESTLRYFPSIRGSLDVVKYNARHSLSALRNAVSKSTVNSAKQTGRLTKNVVSGTVSLIPTPLNLGDDVLSSKPVFGSSTPIRLGNIIPLNRSVKDMIFLVRQM
jgi:hypothetical protein